MSLFSKFFGTNNPVSNEEKGENSNKPTPDINSPLDEQFIYNFKRNGGKFLYCENLKEVSEQFENILAENDWFENEVLCHELELYYLLDENKLTYGLSKEPQFLLSTCENLVAEEGSILFSSNQIKQKKPNELPSNIIILARTSQIIEGKSDGLSAIRRKYLREYPTNITTIKYFEKAKEEDFTQYGSSAKNLYLLLLEDL